MYAPHTVTVYNVIQEVDIPTFTEIERTYVTFLRGVFLDATKAANVRASGNEGADAVNLFIPFSVEAVDPVTGVAKSYVDPTAFMAAEDRSGLWTLSVAGESGETFFVKGEVVESAPVARAMDDSYAVTKVDKKDFGREHMRHFEVGGA